MVRGAHGGGSVQNGRPDPFARLAGRADRVAVCQEPVRPRRQAGAWSPWTSLWTRTRAGKATRTRCRTERSRACCRGRSCRSASVARRSACPKTSSGNRTHEGALFPLLAPAAEARGGRAQKERQVPQRVLGATLIDGAWPVKTPGPHRSFQFSTVVGGRVMFLPLHREKGWKWITGRNCASSHCAASSSAV
ncbi:hypothetical protein SAMN05444817_104105 [Corynebacterium appendicis CIP 107643]|uniref:Uncharacterized protein n=1 Tax=Corynebacterium appendicis CIP 107643 TaxID=1161099 RepID=A0A1N7J7A0_9CORY|nr:hypothetical protein CAPP_09975 [Corynebacterium appendicis CIP 107643]SIS45192.1 hypothetical protein SAMN05444817_104105 [Corynebacterium appendicis CIP 107643]